MAVLKSNGADIRRAAPARCAARGIVTRRTRLPSCASAWPAGASIAFLETRLFDTLEGEDVGQPSERLCHLSELAAPEVEDVAVLDVAYDRVSVDVHVFPAVERHRSNAR